MQSCPQGAAFFATIVNGVILIFYTEKDIWGPAATIILYPKNILYGINGN